MKIKFRLNHVHYIIFVNPLFVRQVVRHCMTDINTNHDENDEINAISPSDIIPYLILNKIGTMLFLWSKRCLAEHYGKWIWAVSLETPSLLFPTRLDFKSYCSAIWKLGDHKRNIPMLIIHILSPGVNEVAHPTARTRTIVVGVLSWQS